MAEPKKISNKTDQFIIVKGARVHNLKNIDVAIPRNKFTVITGLSGSGKSSLAFDTLYAEGQRRYVESLSSYARQFLGRMNKPDVDFIIGISPAIAIEQKALSGNPRSTVGTSTEMFEYIKLLYARIGKTFSPVSGNEVKRHKVVDVLNSVKKLAPGTKALILSPIQPEHGRTLTQQLQILMQQGFSRVWINNSIVEINDIAGSLSSKKNSNDISLVIDRFVFSENDEDLISRIADSVDIAFFEGRGKCNLLLPQDDPEKQKILHYSNRFEADGIIFEEPTVNLFSFNNPFGACKMCEGFGSVIGIDEDLVIPDKNLSVFQDAVVCWRGEKMSEWKEKLIMNAYKFDFPIHRPINELTEEQYQLLWDGNKYFGGITIFFKFVEEQAYKIQYRVMMSRYRGKTVCPDCRGTRIRKDANYVKVGGKSIAELLLTSIEDLAAFFNTIEFSAYEKKVAKRLLIEIKSRLNFLLDVGLGYLTLNRASNTLSGGESQRINLATYLGSSLVGSMYILDEPSIGLHPRDTQRLIKVIKTLRNIGNSVIVVEHDEDIMRASDYLIDMGPAAGIHGGEVVFCGTHDQLINEKNSLTAQYLNNTISIPVPATRKKWKEYIEIKGARENNLKNINVKIPLNILTVITGVSGSGKTSLVKSILYPALKKLYGGYGDKTGKFDKLDGDYSKISNVEFVDQNPIGRSSRSNPVTYVKAYDEIRELFAQQSIAKLRGYKPGYFSFNIPGGRCEECEGAGEVTIEMQFMADIRLTCDNCKGNRFKEEILDVKYKGKSIVDILNLSVEQAVEFFKSNITSKSGIENKIVAKLKPLQDVGLGYIKLGQSSNTLSGGEAQRVKLAFFLSKGDKESPTLFIFDEPSTGLHFHDISKLLDSIYALIKNGHTVIVIEHNPDIVKSADWLIDLGPEGGDKGGNIVFQGIPEDIIHVADSYTGQFLKKRGII
jgi:excinuclease ABC subunit A